MMLGFKEGFRLDRVGWSKTLVPICGYCSAGISEGGGIIISTSKWVTQLCDACCKRWLTVAEDRREQ